MRFLLLVLLTMLGAGCAAPSGPWAQVDDYYNSQADLNVYPAKIVGLDGQMFVRAPPLRLTPGFHTVLLKSTRQSGPPLKPEYATLYLMAKPCVSYYVAAEHECGLCRGWQGVVTRNEPIEGCVAQAAPAEATTPAPPAVQATPVEPAGK